MVDGNGSASDDAFEDGDDGEQQLPSPDQVLDEVAAGRPLAYERLRALSEPPQPVLSRLLALWPQLPPERRRELLATLLQLADDDATLDFHRVHLTALRDADAATRMLAVRGIREQERTEYLRLLTAQLRQDGEASVRAEIADALGHWVISMEFGLLGEDDAEELNSALREAVEDIEEQDEVRARSLEALGASSEESVRELISETYEIGNERLRIAALRAMGRNASESWLPILVYHFDDEDPDIRVAAATAAGDLLVDEAVEPLVMLLDDREDEVQIAAVRALGEIANEESERVLTRMLRDQNRPHLSEVVREALAGVKLLNMEMVDDEDDEPDFAGEDGDSR
ncbi:MAG: hypothetical protein GEU80_12380 [Dehalococcoidia bacterium]|nr:hypothetical protein [Dehalococcoidia bacterium]